MSGRVAGPDDASRFEVRSVAVEEARGQGARAGVPTVTAEAVGEGGAR